jgi:pimeloyl-ACP methyl ester carboxylesterase
LVRAGYSAVAFDGPAHGVSEGRSTSYFEFTDVVSTLIEPDRGFDVHGIVAHSFGAGAVVNGLARRKDPVTTVLLAPALKVKDFLFDAFERHGVPPGIYEKVVADYEARFGYSLDRDDPHRHLGDLRGSTLVVHDRDDSVIAYHDSQALCGRLERVTLMSTSGLGHRKIMTDPEVVKTAVSHLKASRYNVSETGEHDIPSTPSSGRKDLRSHEIAIPHQPDKGDRHELVLDR